MSAWRRRQALRLVAALLPAGRAGGVESDPLPLPQGGARLVAVRAYNEGVALLLARRFGEAQQHFEAALAQHEPFAEAHNNLAYSLRMQGRHNFEASLAHYNRAIALNPALAQAYMYRGMLFLQQGDSARARQDLLLLRTLDSGLAAQLDAAMAGRPAGDERGGIAAQYE